MINRKKHIYNIDKTHHDLTSVFPQYETRNCPKSKKHRQNGDNNNIYHNNTNFPSDVIISKKSEISTEISDFSNFYRTLLIAQC
jgi:hypothetical protein